MGLMLGFDDSAPEDAKGTEPDTNEKAREHERELIIKARAGDADAFAAFIQPYWKNVYVICYGLVRNDEVAREITQETWLRVFKSLTRLDVEQNVGGYIARIASNCCMDWWRDEGRNERSAERQVNLTDLVHEDEAGLIEFEIPDTGALSPEERVILDERNMHLKEAADNALNRLPYKWREVLWLRYTLDHSRAEIARMKNLTVQAIGYRERRAKALFRIYFLEEWQKFYPEGNCFS